MKGLSRRELFRPKPRPGAGDDNLDVQFSAKETPDAVLIPRRAFLAGLLALPVSSSSPSRVEAEAVQLGEKKVTDDESEERYTDTMLETGLLYLANTTAEQLFNPYLKKNYGITLGNARSEEISAALKDKRFLAYFKGIVQAPLTEELAFRLFPAIVIDKWLGHVPRLSGKGDALLPLAVSLSAIFAAGHNVTTKGIDREHIPLPQFFGELFLWHVMRTKGIDHAILSHATYNFAVLHVTIPLLEKFPPKT